MFFVAKNYELNGEMSVLIILPLKSIFERQAVGDGITVLSFCQMLQFSSVICPCEFKTLPTQ